MCLQPSYVYNKYINRYILSDCGHCDSCKQKKASARANRIRYNASDSTVALFFTLTYQTSDVPYIDLRDYNISLSSPTVISSIPVKTKSRGILGILDEDIIIDNKDLYSKTPTRLRTLTDFPSGCVGVCWYPDIQNFFKRLRINLSRHYNYEKKFSYFSCSEYGGKTLRPHFHGLLFVEPQDVQVVTAAIVESWPYADSYRTEKFIEIARDCAGYVASYVNGNSFVSRTLSDSSFRQKHSYSQGFGMSPSSFTLKRILDGIERGDLSFDSKTSSNGVTSDVHLPIPKYVISRFFPKFKGFSRLPVDALPIIIVHPEKLRGYGRIIGYEVEDYHKIQVMLDNSFARYHALTGKNRYDYAIDYLAVWRVYFCTCEKILHQDVKSVDEYSLFYETFAVHSLETLNVSLGYDVAAKCVFRITDLPHRIRETHDYAARYRFRTKQKLLSHTALAESGWFV